MTDFFGISFCFEAWDKGCRHSHVSCAAIKKVVNIGTIVPPGDGVRDFRRTCLS
ncbi:MAG: hypothetical protein KDB01_18970 [Planctomycetaceae bacterium]|nr:hypothetical protein [Planctomycetaceae bacterium]